MNVKLGIRWLVCGMALLFLTAVTAQDVSAAATGKRVALFMGPTQDKYIGTLSKSFEDAAKAAGMEVTTFSSPFDPALQAQQIDDAIAQKYDMLVVQTISQQAVVPPLTRAKAAGIPVMLVIVPLEGAEVQDLFVSYAGYDDVALGRIAGESLAKALTDAGRKDAKIAVLAGSMAEGKAPLREKAFREAIAKTPGLNVVVTEDVKWNPAQAEKTAGQLIARYSAEGGLDAIYGMNDSLANGAIQAASAAGVKFGAEKGSLLVIGGNCQAPGIKNLQDGKMVGTVLMLPAEEGKLAAATAAQFFDGKTPEKLIFIPSEPISKANLDKFGQACSY